MKQKSKKIIVLLIISLIMILNLSTFSKATITDSDNGKMKYYKTDRWVLYDIKGYVNGKLESTTFLDGGYEAYLKVDEKDAEEMLYNDYKEENINGVDWDVTCSFINNGRYVKTTYTLTNKENVAKTISLGVIADVQIAGDDYATIERFENSKGLRLYNTEKNIQFSFYGKSVAGTTDIDNLWIGTFPQHKENYFSNNDINKIEEKDSAFTYSWMNRTLAPGATNRYSTIIGMGEVSNAPKIELDENQGNCFSQDSVIINGTIYDSDKNSKVTLYYVVDDGEEKNLSEQTLVNNSVDFALDLTAQNLTIGKHKIKMWALDESGNPSEILEKDIFITNLKPPTLEMSEEWSKEPVKFKIKDDVNDASDVQKYQYKIADGQWQDAELDTEIVALENTGTTKVTIRVVGKQQDEYSSIISKIAKVDNEGPVIKVEEKDYKVQISATDDKSGVNDIKYLISNKKELEEQDEENYLEYKDKIEYNSTDTNNNEDLYLHVLSTDKLGNESKYVKEYKKPLCANIVTKSEFVGEKPTYKLNIENSDTKGSIYQVKINNGEWNDVKIDTEYTIDNPIEGNNVIVTRTRDALGRTSEEKSVTINYVKKDNNAPTTLPYTGITTIGLVIVTMVGTAVFFKVKNNKYKGI